MAKSCPHPDHSELNEKEKRKKNDNEEKEAAEENECVSRKTYQLRHLKHSWFEKGQDAVVVHIYMKQQTSELVSVDFQDNSMEIKFRTSASDILKLHPGCNQDTLLTWNLFLRAEIDTSRSQYKVLKAMLEIQLKKKVRGRWGSLEMPSFLLKESAKVVMNGGSPISVPSLGASGSYSVSKTETLPQINGKSQNHNGDTSETVDTINVPQEMSPKTSGLGECETAVKEEISTASPKNKPVECVDRASAIPQPPKPPPPPPPPPLLTTSTGVMGGSKGVYNGVRLMRDGQSSDNIASASSVIDRDSSRAVAITTKLGYTGLENLGNTCYLNSIIQCLVNTRKLRDYFLDGKYKQEINTENPLGTGGKLAMGFGSLMKNIWSGKEKHLAPQKLKMIVGEKVCQFKGFMQQDAQEFMAFLLDGLHEDLNRVKDKPYTEEVEGGGRPDSEVATEAWQRHKSRNDSVIVDLFQGQLKSKLTCPVCKKISITFDPFMNLSVPLPKEQKLLPVVVFFKDPSRRPLKVVVKVAQDGPIEQLTAAVERKTGISVNNMMVFEAFRGRFYRFFDKGYNMSTAVATDLIIVAEVLSQEEAGEEVYHVPVIQRLIYPHNIPSHCGGCYRTPAPHEALKRCAHCFSIGYCNQSCQKKHWPTHKKLCKRTSSYVGVPFVVSLPASKATFRALTEMAATYASYSVDVNPGVNTTQEAPPESGSSCKTRGEATRNEPTVCATRAQHSASKSSSTSSDEAPDVYPQFFFKPVSLTGDSLTGPEGARLNDHGDDPLDLSDRNLSLDWRNHPRTSDFVTVSEKKLEYEEDVSCQTEALSDSYSCTLRECLELFTEPETLSDTDAWYCPRCKKHREATKQMSVWRLPEVLVIHLKRFSFRNILFRDKITKLVNFPLRGLDMSPYSLGNEGKEGALYDLFAITNHSGTVNFGHYTSYGRLPPDTESEKNGLKGDGLGWRYFDDRSVSPTSEERVVSKYAYVLFYHRQAAWVSAVNPVSGLNTKYCATNEPEEAEPAVLAKKTEQSSACEEEHSEVREEAERIPMTVVNVQDAVRAKILVEHASSNGNKPREQTEITPTEPVEQDEDNTAIMNLADVDENDLD